MDLHAISEQLRETLDEKRREIKLTFFEEKHIYSMIDENGRLRRNFPSVSKIVSNFHEPFDKDGISLRMSGGDREKQRELLNEWSTLGKISQNVGSRTHYMVDKHLIEQYGEYKVIREPIFSCNEEQTVRSDMMIEAGKNFINLMHERGAVLFDSEIVLGSPKEGYVGQPDDVWIMENKEKTDWGFVITDFKTNAPKNFVVQPYHGKMYPPFQNYPDYAVSHYFLQIPLYGRLLLSMLNETEFKDKKLLGGVVVLLKDTAEFEEYKVPQPIVNKMLSMDLTKFLRK